MATGATRLPTAVVVGLVLAIALDTFTHVTWKLAVAGIPEGASTATVMRDVLTAPLFYAAMAGYLAQLWNWLRVLAHADLSFAQPITALSLVTVLVFSRLILHEHLPAMRLAGVALIMVGVYCVSRTPMRSHHAVVEGTAP